MTPHVVTVLDNSALSTLAECSTRGVVRYHLHQVPTTVEAEAAPLKAGTAVHAAVAHHLRGGTMVECLRVAEVLYRKWAEATVPQKDRRMGWPNVQACLESWLETHPLETLPFAPVPELIEVPFAVRANNNLVLTGKLDAVGRDKSDGLYYIVETKTTGSNRDWWMDQWRLASQVSHYTWCAPHARPVVKVLGPEAKFGGTYINKIDMHLLPSDPHKKCKEHGGVPYAECGKRHASHEIQRFRRSSQQLRDWERGVTVLVERWRQRTDPVQTLDDVRQYTPQEGFFTGACVFCELQDWCAKGRTATHAFKEDRWEPVQQQAITLV